MVLRSLRFSFVVGAIAFAQACGSSAPPVAPPTTTPSAPDASVADAEAPPLPPSAIPATSWSFDKQALHALSRMAYGPRPSDLAAMRRIGVDAWINAQLHPTTLTDDVLSARLASYPTLQESAADLISKYPRPGKAAKAQAQAQAGTPANPGKTGKAGKLGKKNKRTQAAGVGAATSTTPADEMMNPDAEGKPREIVRELTAAKVLRAILSERQLQEVLTDFWFNHFNVFVQKGEDRWLIGAYERDAIRPLVFGKFRDLLGATAHHPAMLFYLDNWQSKVGALNENYGRELLELHTVGVDGGYTQDDVRETARAFTGWSFLRQDATFQFRPRAHDDAAKTVLGTAIAAGGQKDGDQVLDLLAAHPKTAHFLATALATKFVSDAPPASLVDALAAAYTTSGGDLGAVYKVLFFAPEFWSDAAYGAKVKTPLELVASATRAVGASVSDPDALVGTIARMGEPLYGCQPPTGYKSTADAWVGTGALVNRINFGVALAASRVKGVAVDPAALLGGAPPTDAGALVDALSLAILHAPVTPSTRTVIVAEVSHDADHIEYQEPPPKALPQALGLLLGSPEFQHR